MCAWLETRFISNVLGEWSLKETGFINNFRLFVIVSYKSRKDLSELSLLSNVYVFNAFQTRYMEKGAILVLASVRAFNPISDLWSVCLSVWCTLSDSFFLSNSGPDVSPSILWLSVFIQIQKGSAASVPLSKSTFISLINHTYLHDHGNSPVCLYAIYFTYYSLSVVFKVLPWLAISKFGIYWWQVVSTFY